MALHILHNVVYKLFNDVWTLTRGAQREPPAEVEGEGNPSEEREQGKGIHCWCRMGRIPTAEGYLTKKRVKFIIIFQKSLLKK